MDIREYLNKPNDARQIHVGQSGADVYDIGGTHILKHVKKSVVGDEQYATYVNEAKFYKAKTSQCLSYIPEVPQIVIGENETFMLMRKYSLPDKTHIDDDLLLKIAGVLAKIHTDDIPSDLHVKEDPAALLSSDEIKACVDGWISVLDEHPGVMGTAVIHDIGARINGIIEGHDTEPRVLTHGDFHFDNLLLGDDGRLLICDWQNVKVGHASSDLSFFLSRLSADGINIDPVRFINMYADKIKEITGVVCDTDAISAHMAADNIITTFRYWHYFLHGNPEERVREVYDKMVSDLSTHNIQTIIPDDDVKES